MDQHESGEFQREQELVAYLDGELDAEESRRIERLIADDPAARAELNDFERTWSALDSLPRATVDDSFTRSTVEMIAVSEQRENATHSAAQPHVHSRAWVMVVGGVLVAGLLGFFAAGIFVPNPNDRLIADLPILEHFDSYVETESVDFLKALYDSQSFATPLDGETETAPRTSAAAADPDERRAYVASLSPDAKQQLVANFNRFDDTARDEQKRIRTLYEAVNAEPDADELLLVMYRYHEWLKDLQSQDRAALRTLEGADRVAKIREFQAEEAERLARVLPPKDEEPFKKWLIARMEKHMPQHVAELWNRADDRERLGLLSSAISTRTSRPEFRSWKLDEPTPDEIASVAKTLTKPARTKLQSLAGDPTEQNRLLRFWTWDVLPSSTMGWLHRRGRALSDDELREVASRLSDEEKAELMKKSREERDGFLRSRYFRSGGPGPGQGGFMGPPPGGGRGPGGDRMRGNGGPPPRPGDGVRRRPAPQTNEPEGDPPQPPR